MRPTTTIIVFFVVVVVITNKQTIINNNKKQVKEQKENKNTQSQNTSEDMHLLVIEHSIQLTILCRLSRMGNKNCFCLDSASV